MSCIICFHLLSNSKSTRANWYNRGCFGYQLLFLAFSRFVLAFSKVVWPRRSICVRTGPTARTNKEPMYLKKVIILDRLATFWVSIFLILKSFVVALQISHWLSCLSPQWKGMLFANDLGNHLGSGALTALGRASRGLQDANLATFCVLWLRHGRDLKMGAQEGRHRRTSRINLQKPHHSIKPSCNR